MRLEVRETVSAKEDRLEIWLYIANDSISAADRMMRDILAVSERIGEYPQSAQQREDMGENIRAVPIGNYIIYFRLETDAVYVLRILHAARDATPDLLAD